MMASDKWQNLLLTMKMEITELSTEAKNNSDVAKASWADMMKEMIQHCFHRAGFRVFGDDSEKHVRSLPTSALKSSLVSTKFGTICEHFQKPLMGQQSTSSCSRTKVPWPRESLRTSIYRRQRESQHEWRKQWGTQLWSCAHLFQLYVWGLFQCFYTNLEVSATSNPWKMRKKCVLSQTTKIMKQKKIWDYFVPQQVTITPFHQQSAVTNGMSFYIVKFLKKWYYLITQYMKLIPVYFFFCEFYICGIDYNPSGL